MLNITLKYKLFFQEKSVNNYFVIKHKRPTICHGSKLLNTRLR